MSGPERTGFGPRFRWRRFETLRHFITFPLSTWFPFHEMVNVIPSNGETADRSLRWFDQTATDQRLQKLLAVCN